MNYPPSPGVPGQGNYDEYDEEEIREELSG